MLVHLGDKKEESSSTPAPWFLEFLALTNLMLLLTGNTFLTIKMESGWKDLQNQCKWAETTTSCTITRVTGVTTILVVTKDLQT